MVIIAKQSVQHNETLYNTLEFEKNQKDYRFNSRPKRISKKHGNILFTNVFRKWIFNGFNL